MASLASAIGIGATVMLGAATPHAHQGHGDTEPWKVCEGKALDDKCEWQDGEHSLYRGHCREMGGALICVRNQPILRASAGTPDDKPSVKEATELAPSATDDTARSPSCQHTRAGRRPLHTASALLAGAVFGLWTLRRRRQR